MYLRKISSTVCYCFQGHVGGPAPCNSIKLSDCSDMGYKLSKREGEVFNHPLLPLCFIPKNFVSFQLCCKGPNVMLGYFRDSERTYKTIDAQGWLHTGDIARMLNVLIAQPCPGITHFILVAPPLWWWPPLICTGACMLMYFCTESNMSDHW